MDIPQFPFQRAVPTEPAPVLGELRRSCPVAPIRLPSGANAWIVTRYDDVKAVLSDPRFSCAEASRPEAPGFVPFVQLCRSLLSTDGGEHAAVRRVLGRALNPAFLERFRPCMQRVVDDVLDFMQASGPPIDFKEEVNVPLAVGVMEAALGIPGPLLMFLRRNIDAAISINEDSASEVLRLWGELVEAVTGLIAEKRGAPADDIVSAAIAAADQDESVTDDHLVGLVLSLVTPGIVTPIVQISNGLASLLGYDQYRAVAADPGLVPRAVEEMLRFNAPVEVDHLRVTTAEVEVGGTLLPAGSAVFPSITSANRDERRFADADTFDIFRSPNPHIAFGYGPHACVAAVLGRELLVTFFTSLVQRFPVLELGEPFDGLRRREAGRHSVDLRRLHVSWPAPVPAG